MHSRCADGEAVARSVKSWETAKYNSRLGPSHRLKNCYFAVDFVDLSLSEGAFVLFYFALHQRQKAFHFTRAAQMVLDEVWGRLV